MRACAWIRRRALRIGRFRACRRYRDRCLQDAHHTRPGVVRGRCRSVTRGIGLGSKLMARATELRAGNLSLTRDAATLRWIRWRNTEVLRALEFSVRGPTWDTIAPEILFLEIREPDGDGRLTVVLELRHRHQAIDL